MICAVIADDLTGACDSAVQFAAAGLRTGVALEGEPEAEVVAWSTESRDLDAAEAACRLRTLAGRARAEIVFKKIDSTLRGNTRAEVAAALDAFGFDTALVNPGFPEMGRIVEDGWLRVATDPSFRPIHVPSLLGDPRCVCFDDLAEVAGMFGRRVLWVGSAGMAAALAACAGDGNGPFDLPIEHPGPALFCIGSNHPVTLEQERRLVEQRDATVMRVERGGRFELPDGRPSALFVTGGDTASLVCRSLGVKWIELRRELARGIPGGIMRGGLLDGTPIVTKSGGFGAPDDLIHIADYFHA